MIISKTLLLMAISGTAVAGAGLAAVNPAAAELTLVERYGIFGLHAVTVLGIGGAFVRIGFRQAAALEALVAQGKQDRDDGKKLHTDTADDVKKAIDSAKGEILRAIALRPPRRVG